MPIKPRGKFERNLGKKKAYESLFEPQFEIAAWCRDPDAQMPPEQVHFIIHWPANMREIPPMAIRFKSPDTLGFFIEELIRYRREVWPQSQPITSEESTKKHEK